MTSTDTQVNLIINRMSQQAFDTAIANSSSAFDNQLVFTDYDSLIKTGTGITGTSTNAIVFSGSGILYSVVDDLYLNTSTGNLYQCTLSGNATTAKWKYICCLRGATGATGPTGATGATGPTGAAGATGASGYVHFRYAASNPTANSDIKTTPDAWIGVYSGSSATAPTTYTSYSWYNIKGEDGPNTVSTSTSTDIVGLLKGDNDGNVVAAVPGVDYLKNDAACFAYSTNSVEGYPELKLAQFLPGQGYVIESPNILGFKGSRGINVSLVENSGVQCLVFSLPVISEDENVTGSLVPTPQAADANKLLRSDGEWVAFSAIDIDAQPAITASGILKGDGSGGISAAVVGTDYVAPSALASYIPASQKGVANGVSSLDSNAKVTPAQTSARIVSISAAKTLALTDAGTMQQVVSASALTITIPLNSSIAFPVGTEIEVMNYGGGEVTIAAASGVTINGTGNSVSIAEQYTGVVLKEVGADAWVIQGAI